jgi:hypothetical protein
MRKFRLFHFNTGATLPTAFDSELSTLLLGRQDGSMSDTTTGNYFRYINCYAITTSNEKLKKETRQQGQTSL